MKPDLAAARQLDGEGPAILEAEGVRESLADLGLPGALDPPALGERRGLEVGVVARIGDDVDRLAEPERIEPVDLVSRGGLIDPGTASTSPTRSAAPFAVSS